MRTNQPNLFRLATKELSQDSFFAWLLQWGDNIYSSVNPALNDTARDFIRHLIGRDETYPILKVTAGRQWHNIDVWAEINDEYFLCIEDKTNTGEHSGQLERYKEYVTEQYKDKTHQLVFIYLKTGNESVTTLNKVVEKGYKIINRKTVLTILSKRAIQNDIFNDFINYLAVLEELTNSYTQFEKLTSDWKAAEGFYMKLQELIPEWTDWSYVSNAARGFLGFWYHWKGIEDFYLYIQIENLIDYNIIRLVIKISEWDEQTNTLHNILKELEPYADKYELSIQKPDKFRSGKTSTLAIVQDAFIINADGKLEIDKLIDILGRTEKMLDDYTSYKSALVTKTKG